jgi:hypothetical protein
MQSARHSCQILMKAGHARQIFGKYISNFVKLRPVEAELFHAYRRTDRKTKHDADNSSFSQFYERASNGVMYNNGTKTH